MTTGDPPLDERMDAAGHQLAAAFSDRIALPPDPALMTYLLGPVLEEFLASYPFFADHPPDVAACTDQILDRRYLAYPGERPLIDRLTRRTDPKDSAE